MFTDFIRYLFQCAKTHIQEHHRTFVWSSIEDSIEYIFTHPNGWEGLQQGLYRTAIERAGLIPGTPEGRSRVHLLTEGEASLHFCVSNLLYAEKTGRGIVIINAGGGTINLSMFSMTFDPISCEEIAPAECTQLSQSTAVRVIHPYLLLGRLQGSCFVTCRARALLQSWWLVQPTPLPVSDLNFLKIGKLEGWEDSTVEDIAEFTREFDQTTKLVIRSDQEPAYIRVASCRYNNAKYGVSFGKLKLSGYDFVRR